MDRRRAAALQVLSILEERSFSAYLVGGCVRDTLNDKVPLDYDIATSAHPHEVMACFPKNIPTGLQHGTVTVCVDNTFMEVTTFRTESQYCDHRRPNQVTFVTSLASDLSRRDFTINAMAMDRQGNLYDYFGGREDLRRLLLRTVGPAGERFQEDALRMVRAARFVAQLGMTVDPVVERAMMASRHLCRNLAVERTIMELMKIWQSPRPALGAKILFRCGLMSALLPFAHWTEVDLRFLPLLDAVQDPVLCWCILLLCFGTTVEQLSPRLRSLKLSNIQQSRIRVSYQFMKQVQPWKKERIQEWMLREGQETVQRVSVLAYHLGQLTQEEMHQVSLWWHDLHIHDLRQLCIRGGDLLKKAQRPPGPWVRVLLQKLFYDVAWGRLPNEENRLYQEGERWLRDHFSES